MIVHDLSPDELDTLMHVRNGAGRTRWRWLTHGTRRIKDVVVCVAGGSIVDASATDGSAIVSAVDGIPPGDVVRAVFTAYAQRHARRSERATRASVTRKQRQERAVYRAAEDLKANKLTPRQTCRICGRGLSDPDSFNRGIGSECWGHVLALLERIATRTDCDGESHPR
jgi:hypothetical protein